MASERRPAMPIEDSVGKPSQSGVTLQRRAFPQSASLRAGPLVAMRANADGGTTDAAMSPAGISRLCEERGGPRTSAGEAIQGRRPTVCAAGGLAGSPRRCAPREDGGGGRRQVVRIGARLSAVRPGGAAGNGGCGVGSWDFSALRSGVWAGSGGAIWRRRGGIGRRVWRIQGEVIDGAGLGAVREVPPVAAGAGARISRLYSTGTTPSVRTVPSATPKEMTIAML